MNKISNILKNRKFWKNKAKTPKNLLIFKGKKKKKKKAI